MERCLELMQHLPAESIHPAHIAYLQDRVLMRRGEPQVYGTQFIGSSGELRVHPIADPDHLDERRAAVGLGPFAAYEALLRGEQEPDQFASGHYAMWPLRHAAIGLMQRRKYVTTPHTATSPSAPLSIRSTPGASALRTTPSGVG